MPWLRRLANTFRSTRLHREIDRELAFHVAERADDLQREGVPAEEAARRARRQFGNLTLQAERTRDADVSRTIDAFLRDLRYAVRTLARRPGFAASVILILGLGIGANAAVFSALDAVLLRPLPFPDGDRLMRLSQRDESSAETAIAPVRLEDWQRLNETFDAITGYYVEDVSETSGELPEKVRRAFVAPRFVEVWGILPAIGRGFTAAEHLTSGPAAVMISHRYWQRRLAADPNVLNRTVRIGAATMPVVGVMPAAFHFPDRDVDLWFPVALDFRYAQSRKNTWYTGIGRLKPAATLDQARANLSAVQAQLALQFPDPDGRIGVEIVPLKDQTVGGVRSSLWLVFGAVSVLLLITCVNIAALLLSRVANRQQEISLRLSLGASRAAVVSQLLTETALLSLLGGVVGLLVAAAAAAVFRRAGFDLPRIEELAIDGRVLGYTLGTVIAVALLCALLPAIRASAHGLSDRLKDATRAQVSPRQPWQWLLVGVQVALSVTLLVGAGLMVRSWQALSRVESGFDTSRLLTFRVSGNYSETTDYERLVTRIDTTLAELRAMPGVEAAATSMWLPGVPLQFASPYDVVERSSDAEARMTAENRTVSPEYFATMGIPVVAGELCQRQPVTAVRPVMVNQAFARRYLADRPSPVGLHLVATGEANDRPGRISGVVGDARERGLDRDPQPTIYTCFSAPGPTPYFLVRTSTEPASLGQAVRLRLKELEPLRSVYDIAPLDERLARAFAQNRLRTIVLVLFAGTALLLASVGLYGTLSYAVSLRRREIGLRLALGAARGGIVRQVLDRMLRVVLLGALGGLLLSLAFGRWLAGMLFGVSPSDPMTLSLVSGLVLLVAVLAAAGPALRAARLDPVQILRQD